MMQRLTTTRSRTHQRAGWVWAALLVSLLPGLLARPGLAQTGAPSARLTPHNFVSHVDSSHVLTLTFDLTDTGTGPAVSPQITATALQSTSNQPIGTRKSPAALPTTVGDLAAGGSESASVSFGPVTSGQRVKFTLTLACTGANVSTGFYVTVPAADVPKLSAAPGNGSVTLTYQIPADVSYYNIYESSDPNAAPSAYTYLGYSGTTTFTQTGLTNGKKYYYYVVPYTSSGAEAPSATVSALVSLPAPTNLTVTPGNGLATLNWTASAAPGASYYNVYESSDPDAAPSAYTYIGYSSSTTYTQSGLTNGTTYYYYIVPYNNGGAGTPSEIASTTVNLSPVTNLKAVAGNGLINLTWDSQIGNSYFNVYESTSKTGTYTYLGYTGGDATSTHFGYTQSGLSNDTTYYYYVVAYNNGAASPKSAIASATVSLAAVTNLVATAGDGLVKLTWNAPKGLSYFNVYESTDPTAAKSAYTYIGYTGGNSVDTAYSYTQSSLNNGTKYYYYIVAYNNGGPGATSKITSATPNLGAVTNVVATAGNGLITVTWNAPKGLSYFNVYESTDPNAAKSAYTYIGYTGGNGTATSYSYTQSGLNNGTTYYYYIVAYNSGGPGASSAIASATPTLAAVTNLKATAGNGLVTVTWNAPAGLNYFNVYESTSKTSAYTYIGYTGGSTTATSYSYTQSGLNNGTTYYYYIVPYNNGGPGTQSSIASATLTLAAVTSLTATPGNGLVTLNWKAPAGLSYFNVYESTDPTAAKSAYTYIGYTGGNGTDTAYTYTQSGLSNGTKYYYYVVPYNNGGPGDSSAIASATVSLAPVTGLAAQKNDGAATVTWNAPAGLSYFNVYESTDPNAAKSAYTYLGYTGGSGTATSYSYTQSGLSNSTTYYYYVVPYNNGGAGTPSGIVHD